MIFSHDFPSRLMVARLTEGKLQEWALQAQKRHLIGMEILLGDTAVSAVHTLR